MLVKLHSKKRFLVFFLNAVFPSSKNKIDFVFSFGKNVCVRRKQYFLFRFVCCFKIAHNQKRSQIVRNHMKIPDDDNMVEDKMEI